jgi:hypothetical protein
MESNIRKRENGGAIDEYGLSSGFCILFSMAKRGIIIYIGVQYPEWLPAGRFHTGGNIHV